ncbi:hypothetical protein XA68_15806 [Ophiocordyceps unilateralis]|uniref:Dol-P-Glc:Glc(2)Man(9)GlcNAc(2)-PP-Dol alpha-1,2-glucosyltransferase n=1 Tax=Ophiocordyceps unilateralis TaxID=268505 RepID=A0A2A9PM16_OPHUN|nr:hypothetical protein XA68_15806 [Ophiocordyceps unilateralis]
MDLLPWAVAASACDEVFHIPQAQRYCHGRFGEWDDKITTPPGLYLLSNLLPQAFNVTGLSWTHSCEPNSLRAFNLVGLAVLAYLFLLCRRRIEERLSPTQQQPPTRFAIHSACNVALFPLLFFFSGLYYTDVASTAVVLAAFLNHLNRVARDRSSTKSDLFTVALGLLALLMRQTNVFWAVVYMGGMEVVHAITTMKSESKHPPVMNGRIDQLLFMIREYSIGRVHDPPLCKAKMDDTLLTAFSFGIAALCNPIRVLRQIWPYMTVLGAFVVFVVWNGAVVLGDKSNHVATIHFAQLLYMWPLFVFFSWPLLLPQALGLDAGLRTFLTSVLNARWATARKENDTRKHALSDATPKRRRSQIQKTSQKAERLRNLLWIICFLGAILLCCAIVRFNTIIHPFTLADNRHYMFYVFRYSIGRASWIRYTLVGPYLLSCNMIMSAMAGYSKGCQEASRASHSQLPPAPPRTNFIHDAESEDSEVDEDAEEAGKMRHPGKPLRPNPLRHLPSLPYTSTGLIWLLATSLSLVTAPLVEPRYFIAPWVLWRLLVPEWRLCGNQDGAEDGPKSRHDEAHELFRWHDMRLVVETAWFAVINLATCYVFIAKPFIWRDEAGGVLDNGRLQRFMW